MRRKIWIGVLGLVLIAGAGWGPAEAAEGSGQEEELYPVLVDGKFGYADAHGVMVIAPQFDQARNFVEGLACVARAGKWGYINTDGHLVVEPRYEWAFDLSGGLARAGSGFEVDYINREGRSVGPQKTWLTHNPFGSTVQSPASTTSSTARPLASIPAMP